MYNITYKNETYLCRDDETVLESLSRNGVELSFSCRKGSCQVCLLNCVSGSLPEDSQESLRPIFKKLGYFLPCICKPIADIEVAEIDRDNLYQTAYVYKKEMLSENVCRLFIESDKFMNYRGGQFLNLCRPDDGIARSYSIANCPENDYYLELHVQRMPGGVLSNWIFNDLNEFDEVEIQGPNGNCIYHAENDNAPILMVATNTGLAPLLGVLHEIILNDHKGEVHLYHECTVESELYQDSYLKELVKQHKNIVYHPCVPDTDSDKNRTGMVAENTVDRNHSDLSDWLVYLAGGGQMVERMYELAIKKGASEGNVFSDAFDLKDLRIAGTDHSNTYHRRSEDNEGVAETVKEKGYPEPDPEIWEALDQGRKLNKILDDFYTIVYEDKRLSPFFSGITKQRSIEKVYLFLRQVFTGEKVYIGDRPRNAHHWMVISDDLFDYREDIMADCLVKNGIPENIIKRWRAIEEAFRPDIVKDKPWNKIVNGIELPVEGYEEMELDSGTMCDRCHQPVEAGTKVRYHVRLGEVYCPNCMSGKL